MVMIKKWQDDLLCGLVVLGSVVGLKEPYWKLPCFAAAYWADGWLKDNIEKRILATKSENVKMGWKLLGLNASVVLRFAPTCIVLEQPVRAFASSCGYGNGVAEMALRLIGLSLFNWQSYKGEGGKSSVDYNSDTSISYSKVAQLLKSCLHGLLANSFEEGTSKHPKLLLLRFLLIAVNSLSFYYSTNQEYDVRKIAKQALLASVAIGVGDIGAQRCNFDNFFLESVVSNLFLTTIYEVGFRAMGQ